MGKLLQFVPVLLQVLSSVFVHHPGAPEDKKAAAVVVGKSLLGTVVDDVAAYEPAVLGLVAARPNSRVELPNGLLAVRGREYVRLSRSSPQAR